MMREMITMLTEKILKHFIYIMSSNTHNKMYREKKMKKY